MFKKIVLLFFCFLILGLSSCGKRKDDAPKVENKNIQTANSDENKDSEEVVVVHDTTTSKQSNATSGEKLTTTTKTVEKKNIHLSKNYKIYNNLKILLASIKLGETKTKQELIDSKIVPDDALQIVKSVTKVSENELAVAWKSTWLVEKISDVKLNDDIIKVRFKDELIYTSGNAIGIKYEGKVHHDLIIKGDRAYIPTVKEYNWKIGKQ